MGVRLKIGVTIKVTAQLDRIMRVAEVAYGEVMGPDFSVVVTSGNDGKHMDTSLHYKNLALDFRTGHNWDAPLMSEDEARELCEELKARLGMGFDVVLEKDHAHVEYDPKTGAKS